MDFTVTPEYDGKKVQNFLRGNVHISSRLLGKLKHFDDGLLLNGRHIRTIDIIRTGDLLTVNIPEDSAPAEPSNLKVIIPYEDEDVIVAEKPPFMTVHPTRNHQGDTLANAVAAHLESEGKKAAFRPINRLDRDTSGLVVAGLNTYSASRLTGNIRKVYMAVVCGKLEGSGTIDAPIRRQNERYIFREVGEGGERAVTHWEAVKTDGELTLLKIRLETGRTHQIRVHFAYIGHPLVGDTMYGKADEKINRQALHCAAVSFEHPVSGKKIEIMSELPEDMKKLI